MQAAKRRGRRANKLCETELASQANYLKVDTQISMTVIYVIEVPSISTFGSSS